MINAYSAMIEIAPGLGPATPRACALLAGHHPGARAIGRVSATAGTLSPPGLGIVS